MIRIREENASHSHRGPAALYVGLCHGVTDHDIRRATDAGVRTVSELTMRTGLGSGCGSCVEMAGDLMREAQSRPLPVPVLAAAA